MRKLILLLALVLQGQAAPVVLNEWTQLTYEFASPEEEQEALANGTYIPENCALTGIKYYDGVTFLTVPRWKRGVPATLVTVTDEGKLAPFPSFAAQDPTNCEKIQYVQSMEIDRNGIMYVVDVGRKYFVELFNHDNTCPPKIVLLDLKNGAAEVERYVFPDEVASHTGSFLNDIVLDQARDVAYISDAEGGGIVVYDRGARASRRWEGPSTKNDPAVVFVIDGVDYGASIFTTPADGIALSPDTDRLVYSALQGVHLYALPTALLRNFSTSSDEVEEQVDDLGRRPSPADGLAFSAQGNLFLTGITTASVYKLSGGNPPAEEVEIVTRNDTTHQWPDTLAFDGRGNLLFTTNRLDRFFTGTMDPSELNYRVVSVYVGETSYIDAEA